MFKLLCVSPYVHVLQQQPCCNRGVWSAANQRTGF